ncbi:MAG: GNAT family N-acetyltransferase [Dysosmobacter sp.]
MLHTLVVDPTVKGKGYGTAFVAFYEQLARKRIGRTLRIGTNARNTPARALYKKLGYAEAGIVAGTFNGIPNVQLVCLEKKV